MRPIRISECLKAYWRLVSISVCYLTTRELIAFHERVDFFDILFLLFRSGLQHLQKIRLNFVDINRSV